MLNKLKEGIMSIVGRDPGKGKERRRHRRFACIHRTKLRYDTLSSSGTTVDGEIHNISVSGVLFVPDRPPEPDLVCDNARLYIDGSPVAVDIVRVSFNGYHIAFAEQMDEATLRDFLEGYGRKID